MSQLVFHHPPKAHHCATTTLHPSICMEASELNLIDQDVSQWKHWQRATPFRVLIDCWLCFDLRLWIWIWSDWLWIWLWIWVWKVIEHNFDPLRLQDSTGHRLATLDLLVFGVVGCCVLGWWAPYPPPPPLPHTTYITILRLQLFKRLTYRYMMPNSDSTVQKTHLYTYMLKDSLIDLLIIYDSAQIQTQLSKRRTCTLIDAQRFTYRRTYSIWFCSNSDSTVQKTHL